MFHARVFKCKIAFLLFVFSSQYCWLAMSYLGITQISVNFLNLPVELGGGGGGVIPTSPIGN